MRRWSHTIPVENVVSSAQLWRPIQERVKDTVVQIFSQVAEFDLLQPYRTLHKVLATGSGFFINEEGELLLMHMSLIKR